MSLVRAALRRALAAPPVLLVPVAVLLASATLMLVGGVGGRGPLGPVFAGPAVPDINPGDGGSRARGGNPRSQPRPGRGRPTAAPPAGAPTAGGTAGGSSEPRGSEPGGGPRPNNALPPDGQTPTPPPGRPSPDATPPPSPAPPASSAPPVPAPSPPAADPVGDTARGVGEALPEPARSPANEVIDGALGPGG